MALAQEFLDLFVRIAAIERCYPGGFAAYRTWIGEELGHTVWHDEHLIREGAMSSADVEALVDVWADRGLKTYREEAGEPVEWLEFCVSMGIAGQPTLPCSWIAYDEETGGAYLKGTAPGPLIGPTSYRAA